MRSGLLAVLVSLSPPAVAATTGTVVNADGQPVAGAKVSAYALESSDDQLARLFSGAPRPPIASARSDAKGNFSIEGTAPVVDLRIESRTQRVVANDDAGFLQVGGVPMIQATITANGKPLSGAVVTVISETDHVTTTTDETGRYTLPDPKRGLVRVIISHPDYAIVERMLAPFLPVKPDIAMTRGVPLNGRVVAEDGETGVKVRWSSSATCRSR